ncbi:MAG TPA: paraslipin [Deltaproteobacteria bacterium]|nr:paraslipin [Deltaproteobacteria bacterium]
MTQQAPAGVGEGHPPAPDGEARLLTGAHDRGLDGGHLDRRIQGRTGGRRARDPHRLSVEPHRLDPGDPRRAVFIDRDVVVAHPALGIQGEHTDPVPTVGDGGIRERACRGRDLAEDHRRIPTPRQQQQDDPHVRECNRKHSDPLAVSPPHDAWGRSPPRRICMVSLLEFFTLGALQFCVVRQGEIKIIERRGKFIRVATPGVSLLLSMWGYGETIGTFMISQVVQTQLGPQLTMRKVDTISTRTQVDDYPKESIITRDNATVHIDAVVYYRVHDPTKAVYEVQDYVGALQKLVQSALRDECGKYELDELLTSRDRINSALRTQLDVATDPWGIKVDRVELKDIDLGEFGNILAEQRATETRRRTAITEAEGLKQASILKAEGLNESAILEAEAEKKSMILLAEGRKEAAILASEAEATALLKHREAEARGFVMLKQVFGDGTPASERLLDVVKLMKASEVGEKLANGQATKLFLPAEIQSLFGLADRIGRG